MPLSPQQELSLYEEKTPQHSGEQTPQMILEAEHQVIGQRDSGSLNLWPLGQGHGEP